MSDDIIKINCEIPMQCEFIDEDENRDMVSHDLKEDAKLFKFIITFDGSDRWSYVTNNGIISKLRLVYFHFIRYSYVVGTGKRTVTIGFICWVRGIYATIDIDFNVYPRTCVQIASNCQDRV
jgi:hypothetical protein